MRSTEKRALPVLLRVFDNALYYQGGEQLRYHSRRQIMSEDKNYNETAKETLGLLQDVQNEKPSSIMTLYFVVKTYSKEYNAFKPQVSPDVQSKILDIILPNTIESLSREIVAYNAVGVADEEIELLNPTQVPYVQNFLDSIKPDTVFTDLKELKINKINFYVIEIHYHNQQLFLFRQFTKMSKLRKGFMLQLFENQLREMENDFLGLDQYTDMVLMGDTLFVLNHISLERVFNYRDQYQKNTEQALGAILNQDIMVNINQFAEDCKNDIRIMKRFTNLMSQDRLPLFFDHFDRVPEIVKTLGLDIEFDEDGKLIYREKSQMFHIINLMSDAYFKSLLNERYGVAKTEEAVK